MSFFVPLFGTASQTRKISRLHQLGRQPAVIYRLHLPEKKETAGQKYSHV
jgi:hypothetical protein